MATRPPRRTPPAWLNRLTSRLLTLPVLSRVIGRSTALLTFTGRRTGRTYTTPISYVRDGPEVVLTAHRSRIWWRSVEATRDVTLVLAGEVREGRARIVKGDEAVIRLTEFARSQRMVGRGAGVRYVDGEPEVDSVREALGDTVVVVVGLTTPAGDLSPQPG